MPYRNRLILRRGGATVRQRDESKAHRRLVKISDVAMRRQRSASVHVYGDALP